MARAGNRTRRSAGANATSSDYGQRLLSDALSISSSLIQGQKQFGAERLQEFAQATRDYAGSLQVIPGIGSYVRLAADSAEALADYVVETNLEDMISDATAFARRQPLATLLLAVSAGLVGTFLIRAQMGSDKRTTRRSAAAKSATKRKSPSKRGRKAKTRANGTSQTAVNA